MLPRSVSTFLEMIKFAHSVFALPFALVAMLVAANGWPSWGVFAWIVVAAVAARTAAMCFNRIADRRFDADNPRTAKRALVTGELSMGFAWAALLLATAVFYLAAAMLNPLCLVLATPCLAVLLGYSLLKRVTDFTHFGLGVALGLAPVGAWIATTGAVALAPLVLAAGVMLWVAGFDLIYSCQDYEHDRGDARLHSLPKRLGIAWALRLAERLHVGALAAFLGFYLLALPTLGVAFGMALVVSAALMIRQHGLVSPRDLGAVNKAFFDCNATISVLLLAGALVDTLVA